MRSWALGLLLFAGCDQVFGLRGRQPIDAVPTGDGGDGGSGILAPPPDTGVACGPRPSFETWQFAQGTLAFDKPDSINALAFYQAGSEVRAIVTTGTGDALYEVAADGEAMRLTSLDPPGNGFVRAPRLSPEGSVLWFQQSGVGDGVYYATRASSWVKRRADLGFLDAEAIEPGSVGYYRGTIRMVITVRLVGAEATLREISSVDGLTWTMLDTVQVENRSFNPHLSRDGCYLLFSRTSTFTEIHVADRTTAGDFTTSVSLVPSSLTTAANNPAMAPDESRMWFACDGALCRGQP